MIFERSKAEILRHTAKPFLRGFQRAVEVGFLGMGEGADLLAGGGVHDRQRAAGRGGAPCAVDEELGIWVHGGLDRVTGKEPPSLQPFAVLHRFGKQRAAVPRAYSGGAIRWYK